MPKMKTHSGTKKRFSLTGTGKVKRPQAGMNHKTETKSRKKKRQLRKYVLVSSVQDNTIKGMMPYKK